MDKAAYDVVVLGAGPAGLATALALSNYGNYRILIADAGQRIRERAGESAPPDLLFPLRRLQLEEAFLAAGHTHSAGSAVLWGRDLVGYNDHLLNRLGPSWRLHRQAFDAMLLDAALKRNLQVAWNTRFIRAEAESKGFALHLTEAKKQPVEIQASWVVDASGPLARFAQGFGIKKRVDDQLFGLAAYRKIQSGQMSKQVLVESRPNGWWYATQLPDQRVLQLFVTDAPQVRQLKMGGEAAWKTLTEESKLIASALSGLSLGKPAFHTFPIYSSLLEQTYGPNWLAVGDAAATYDPIASQGLYKALSDGLLAGQVLARTLNGDTSQLETYAVGIKTRYEQYFIQRCTLYAQEQRWMNARFWQNRHNVAMRFVG